MRSGTYRFTWRLSVPPCSTNSLAPLAGRRHGQRCPFVGSNKLLRARDSLPRFSRRCCWLRERWVPDVRVFPFAEACFAIRRQPERPTFRRKLTPIAAFVNTIRQRLWPPAADMDYIKDGWFMEKCTLWPGQAMSLKVNEVLYNKKSKYQDVLVFKRSVALL